MSTSRLDTRSEDSRIPRVGMIVVARLSACADYYLEWSVGVQIDSSTIDNAGNEVPGRFEN